MPWEQIGLTALFKATEVLFVVVLAAVMAGAGYLIKCATEALRARTRSGWARRLDWINKWAERAFLPLLVLLVLSIWISTNWQCAGNYLEHGQLKTEGQMMESSSLLAPQAEYDSVLIYNQTEGMWAMMGDSVATYTLPELP